MTHDEDGSGDSPSGVSRLVIQSVLEGAALHGGEATKREIMETVPDIPVGERQVLNGLQELRKAGKASYHIEGNRYEWRIPEASLLLDDEEFLSRYPTDEDITTQRSSYLDN